MSAEDTNLDLNEVWLSNRNKLSIAFNLCSIPRFHKGKSVHSSLPLFWEGFQASNKSFPEITKKWAINFLQAVLCACIHTNIQLGDWVEISEEIKNKLQ